MTVAPQVTSAARRILDGDDSRQAAASLEEALHTYTPYEERFDDLLEALALYAPSMGSPYIDHGQLCNAIRLAELCEEGGG
jgi:hypothetical protein